MNKILLLLLILISVCGFQPDSLPTNCIKLKHKDFISIYDTTLDYPVMVSWIDTKIRIGCKNPLPRKDCFAADPLLLKHTNLQPAYDKTNQTHKAKGLLGVDRGHMCPAADNTCDVVGLKECFYFSNMAPQYHSLNAGDWKKIEVLTRELALQFDSVYVWCGSVGTSEKVNGMSIPKKCWKVIYVKKTSKWDAYIFDNTPVKPQGIDHWRVKKEDVEKLSGLKFTL